MADQKGHLWVAREHASTLMKRPPLAVDRSLLCGWHFAPRRSVLVVVPSQKAASDHAARRRPQAAVPRANTPIGCCPTSPPGLSRVLARDTPETPEMHAVADLKISARKF